MQGIETNLEVLFSNTGRSTFWFWSDKLAFPFSNWAPPELEIMEANSGFGVPSDPIAPSTSSATISFVIPKPLSELQAKSSINSIEASENNSNP